jgi:hypothetical protein
MIRPTMPCSRVLAAVVAAFVTALLLPLASSCSPRSDSSGTQGNLQPTYRRLEAPSEFVITDPEGDWACVSKDDQGRTTSIVVGLATGEGDERYPRLPKTLFADPLEVSVGQGLTVQVPRSTGYGLLVVTTRGFSEFEPPWPLGEVASGLWDAERDGRTIRQIAGLD